MERGEMRDEFPYGGSPTVSPVIPDVGKTSLVLFCKEEGGFRSNCGVLRRIVRSSSQT